MKHYLCLIQNSRIAGADGYSFHFVKEEAGARLPKLPPTIQRLEAAKEWLESEGWQEFKARPEETEFLMGASIAELGRMDLGQLTWVFYSPGGTALKIREMQPTACSV